MELQAQLKQYKPLNQQQMNEFIELLIADDISNEVKANLLSSF